jgi:hypothetical protein
MRKVYLVSAGFAMLSFLLSSCEKEEAVVTKTINVELEANSTFSYTIPKAGDEDDVMQITQQGSHFLKSEVIESGPSAYKFSYTPALNFEGSDEVKVSTEEDRKSGNGHHGMCSGKGKDDETVYDFKITIRGSTK